MPAFGPNNTGLKSIQRGIITLNGTATATATITAVNTAKTELRFMGSNTGAAALTDAMAHLTLTNSTTVTATRTGITGVTSVSWELSEFY